MERKSQNKWRNVQLLIMAIPKFGTLKLVLEYLDTFSVDQRYESIQYCENTCGGV